MKKYLSVLLLLALVLSACSTIGAAFENGEIAFVDPDPKAVFHGDNTGEPYVAPVSLKSTFDEAKLATLSVDGIFWSCTLAPNATTPCIGAILQVPGEHLIRAEVFKRDGVTVVSTETKVLWTPYSSLDKTMQNVASVFGTDNPLPGYGLMIFLVACLAALALGKIFGAQWGAILGFLVTLIGLAFYFNASGATLLAGQVLLLIGAIFGFAVVAFMFFMWLKHNGSLHVGPKVVYRDLRTGKEIEMSQRVYLGPADRGPDLPKIGNAAADMMASLNEDQVLLPDEEIRPLLDDARRRRR